MKITKEQMLSDLKGKSDAAYIEYVEVLRRDECLGWEQKVRTGRFGDAELKAHTLAAERLGMHRAYADAVKDLRQFIEQSPSEGEAEQGDGPCQEADGCPTELAVLQRFWRGEPIPQRHIPAWAKDHPAQEGRKAKLTDEALGELTSLMFEWGRKQYWSSGAHSLKQFREEVRAVLKKNGIELEQGHG